MNTTHSNIERLIHEALTELGWDTDPKSLIERVRRLEIGLPREDEFSVICGWLGQCALIHKLDQQQHPLKSRNDFQVPDLFAVFDTKYGKVPVLIEVKSSTKHSLSLKPEYIQKLHNYAQLLKLPLLFAWKYHGIWVLVDSACFKKAAKNFNLPFSEAIKENLLGVLAGDFSYTLGKGAGLHIRFRKDKLLSEKNTDDGVNQEWVMYADKIKFTDHKGACLECLDPQIQSLFMIWDLDENQNHTETHMELSYVAKGDTGMFAHQALVRLLSWEISDNRSINWREQLMKESILKNSNKFSTAVNAALQQKIVYHIFYQQPQTMPSFLSKVDHTPSS